MEMLDTKKIITMTQAKQLGLKQYYTGKPCKYGHVVKRYVASRLCSICAMNKVKKFQKENPEKILPSMRASQKKYYNERRDRIKEARKAWKKRNPHVMTAEAAKRKAAKLKAIPKWADMKKIKEIYNDARKKTKETGIQHHVDHIFPLRGKTSCGLHVENNLQILTAKENIAKGNSLGSW